MIVFLNGELVDESEAFISIADTAFLQGCGLFETMRAYNGKIFAIELHLERLINSALDLNFNDIPEQDFLINACNNIIKANNLSNARVRITLSRGFSNPVIPTSKPSGTGSSIPKPSIPKSSTSSIHQNTNLLITVETFNGYPARLYKTGMSATTLKGFRYSNDFLVKYKTTSYFGSVLAREKAKTLGFDEALLINEKENICEGSFTNIFAVKDNNIFTPKINEGLLPGVTRHIVIELAKKNGFKVEETSIKLSNIQNYDEYFLTNSLLEVMPLTSINRIKINNGYPGRITSIIHQLYSRAIAQ